MAASTALLLTDVQTGIVERVPGGPELVQRLVRAAEAARAAKIPVIHAMVGYRPGYPEISPNNKDFARFIDDARFQLDDPKTAIAADLGPADGDIVVVKSRVGAFTGGDLDVILRSLGIDHLVLGGISTSGSVLTTVRESADRDFALTVLSDGCVDALAETHQFLTEKVFPRQAVLKTVEEWAAEIG